MILPSLAGLPQGTSERQIRIRTKEESQSCIAKQEEGEEESDISQKLAALQTSTPLEDAALLEASETQGSENYRSRFIPRAVAGPSFMDRKLQQLKVYLKGIISFPLTLHNHLFASGREYFQFEVCMRS